MISRGLVRLLAWMADRWDVPGDPHPESVKGACRRIAIGLRRIARDLEERR